MTCTLKVRDRTTNKIKEVQIDQEDYERLKGYNYLIDKNSKEPFREVSLGGGKRPRIALKRDVMGFEHGDPRRVCYVDKEEIMDCRKSNLKTNPDIKETKKKVVKVVKTVNPVVATAKPEKAAVVVVEKPVVVTPVPVLNKLSVTDVVEVKKALIGQIDPTRLADLIPMEDLLAVWAESHGYKKQA